MTFNIFDLIGVYSVSGNKGLEQWFLTCRSNRPYLIDQLLGSVRWADNFVEVYGNFKFGPEEEQSYHVSY